MNWSHLVRQTHRWTCIAFVASVVSYMAAMTKGQPPAWLGVFPAGALILLLATGLWMFVLPYAAKWRAGRLARA